MHVAHVKGITDALEWGKLRTLIVEMAGCLWVHVKASRQDKVVLRSTENLLGFFLY